MNRSLCAYSNAARAVARKLDRQQRWKRLAPVRRVIAALARAIWALVVWISYGIAAALMLLGAYSFVKDEPLDDASDIEAILSKPAEFECPSNLPPIIRTSI